MNHKELLILSIITLVTVVAWIAFGIIHARKQSTVTTSQLHEVVPLKPGFDTNVIRSLMTREE